jgi:PAS domain S-box-containing protein
MEFEVVRTIEERPALSLLRARRDGDGGTVVLKVLGERASARDAERLRHEYEIGASVEGAGAIRIEALTTWQGRPALVMESFGDATLEQLLAAPMSVEDALEVTLQIAAALAELHARGIVHKDVRPQNVFVESGTMRVKLAGFELASLAPSEPQPARPPALIEGALPYMSPEQTGRMNRALDERSDLYSLGVTLYRMLTGRLPFEAADPLEWVHCHLARSAPPPSALEAAIPPVLSQAVMKLLAKVAEERYQSARGVEHDLARCLRDWRRGRTIEPFALGAHDVPARFHIARRLYGRERESAALERAFERVAAGGSAELVLVSGYSGVGKSSLVSELARPVVAGRGFFLSGKFDQLGRAGPYAPIAGAFRALVEEILAGSEDELGAWRDRLAAALGDNGRLVVDLIPALGLVTGLEAPPPALPPAEAQARFYAVVRAFLSVVARKEHPVVLFLDDLQWADPASLDLLVHVLGAGEARHLLVIGAFRNNEVNASHPLTVALDRARAGGMNMSRLVLEPLAIEPLGRLIADTLHTTPAAAGSLTALVHQKTAGNPFFATQFLMTLHEDGLIRRGPRAGAWGWDIERIRAKGISDNVVDLLVAKIASLPQETQEGLRLSACMGATAEVSALATIYDRAEEDTHRTLAVAVREGLLLRQDSAYRFAHDRVQQAAHSLIPEEERSAVHLRVGRLLLAGARADELPERVFAIVDQFNRALPLVTDEAERGRLAELNVMAARRAKAAAAHRSAAAYLASAMELLGEGAWSRNRALAWDVHFERAQCEHIGGSLDAAETLLSVLLPRAVTRLEQASVYRLWIAVHVTRGQYADVIDKGRRALAVFGIRLPARPSTAEVDEECEAVWRALGERFTARGSGPGDPANVPRWIQGLLELPVMTDPEALAAGDILWAISTAALNLSRGLFLVINCQLVTLGIRHGHSGPSCRGYAAFGMELTRTFGRYQDGYRFAKLGADLIDRHGFSSHRAVTFIMIGAGVYPWTRPLAEGVAHVEIALEAALGLWQINPACWAAWDLLGLRFVQGLPLAELERLGERYSELARRARWSDLVGAIEDLRQGFRELRGQPGEASNGRDDDAQAESFVNRAAMRHALRLQVHFLFGRYHQAFAEAEKARALDWNMTNIHNRGQAHYYRALTLAALFDEAPAEQRRAIEGDLQALEEQLAEWARHCRPSFLHKHLLVAAERARIAGGFEEPVRLYQRAIAAARENGFVQDEAVVYELAARFYRAQGLRESAQAYLREARGCYERWGADAKVHEIDRLHPGLAPRLPVALEQTLAVRAAELDLLSVVKAGQTISREMLLSGLRDTLMRVVLEQAGAQRGWLVSPGEDMGPGGEALPPSILQYVTRTRQPVIVEDATKESRFAGDPSLARRRTRSVLCLPVVRGDELVALLYLENDLAAGAFTPDKLAVLELLSGQIAISLDNARLYADLHRSRAQVAAILENMADAVVVLDRDRQVILVNGAAARLLRIDRDARERLSADALSSRLHFRQTAPPTPFDRALAGEIVPLAEAELAIDADGGAAPPPGRRALALSAAPVRDEDGALAGVVTVIRDVTELVELDRLKDQFVRVAAHELKTPAAILQGYSELLSQTPAALSEEQRRIVEGIRRGALRIDRIGTDLGYLSLVQLGRLAPVIEPVDLNRLAGEALETVSAKGRERVVIHPGERVTVEGDRLLLLQVLTHLIDNALRYSPGGEPVEIEIGTADGRDALVAVHDHGVGIPRDKQARVFECFYRAHMDTPYDFGGMGTGLFLARELITRHGGAIWFHSAEGRGSTFAFRVPLKRGAEPPEPR